MVLPDVSTFSRACSQAAKAAQKSGKMPQGKQQWWEKELEAAKAEEDGSGGSEEEGAEAAGTRKRPRAEQDDEDDDRQYFKYDYHTGGVRVYVNVCARVHAYGYQHASMGCALVRAVVLECARGMCVGILCVFA